jgi:hypothetical protein
VPRYARRTRRRDHRGALSGCSCVALCSPFCLAISIVGGEVARTHHTFDRKRILGGKYGYWSPENRRPFISRAYTNAASGDTSKLPVAGGTWQRIERCVAQAGSTYRDRCIFVQGRTQLYVHHEVAPLIWRVLWACRALSIRQAPTIGKARAC